MVTRHNPTINEYLLEDEYTSEDMLDLGDESKEFAMAFGLADGSSRILNDPFFVRWQAQYILKEIDEYGKKTTQKKAIDLHPCTTEDFSKFYPPDERKKARIEDLKTKGGLYCADWKKHGVKLYGEDRDNSYSMLDINAIPCHVRQADSQVKCNGDK